MSNRFQAKKIADIFAESRDALLLHELHIFLCHKLWDLTLPLSDAETIFYRIKSLGSSIVGEGWNSLFDQTFSYSALQSLIDLFRGEIPLPSLATKLEAARSIYYLGRTDLDHPSSLWIGNDVSAHLTDKAWDNMMAHGDGALEEGGEISQLQPLFAALCRTHQREFLDPQT